MIALVAGVLAYAGATTIMTGVNFWSGRLRLEARLSRTAGDGAGVAATRALEGAFSENHMVLRLAGSLESAGVARAGLVAPALAVIALPAFAATAIALRSLLKAAGLAALAAAAGAIWIKRRAEERRREMAESLPAVLDAVASGMAAGLSMRQAFRHAIDRVPTGVAVELQIMTDKIELGLAVDEALKQLAARLQIVDIEMIVAAISIQRSAGGNIVELLHRLGENLEERSRLYGELRVETAQARLSANVIGVMPVVVVGAVSVVDPKFIAPLFMTPVGLGLFALAAALEVIGFIALSKILEVRL